MTRTYSQNFICIHYYWKKSIWCKFHPGRAISSVLGLRPSATRGGGRVGGMNNDRFWFIITNFEKKYFSEHKEKTFLISYYTVHNHWPDFFYDEILVVAAIMKYYIDNFWSYNWTMLFLGNWNITLFITCCHPWEIDVEMFNDVLWKTFS